jgi:hypothetical protein
LEAQEAAQEERKARNELAKKIRKNREESEPIGAQ